MIDTPEITNSHVEEPLEGKWQGYLFRVEERLEAIRLFGGSRTHGIHKVAIFSVSDNQIV